ncbi:MAG TPA: hypothetical protein VNZ85_05865 [Caulobacter sp.]|nr:hypothetical protein [Caulobacter sp.]
MPAQTPATDARILQFREWIANAEHQGATRPQMQLHLSHRDLSGLKRSPGVRTEEISFLEGVMWFLGVEVLTATTSPSRLAMRPPA